MSSSTYNPDHPDSKAPRSRRGVLRSALPPPAPDQPFEHDLLLADDDPGALLDIRRRATQLSGDAADFAAYLGELLANSTWEHRRLESLRAASLNLQVEDDRAEVDAAFTTIDGPSRQSLAYRKLADQQSFRFLSAESDRYFRRIRQSLATLRQVASRKLR